MKEVRPSASRRTNRNTLWLLGLAVAAVLVAVLMLNSRASIQAGSQIAGADGRDTPTGMASAGAGGASGGAQQGWVVREAPQPPAGES